MTKVLKVTFQIEVLLEKARFETFGDLIRHLNDRYLRTEWHRKRFTILGIEEQ